jgi:predicted esterase
MLVRKEMFAQASEAMLVLAIHGHGGGCEQLAPLCSALGRDVSAVLPQAWRPLNIHGIVEPVHPGYSWYYSFAADQPEPATFGDCLIELENLVYDLLGRGDRDRVAILGVDQGATLALALAGVIPEWISAVVAIGGCLPRIKGCSLPAETLNGLPILMISGETRGAMWTELNERTARDLKSRGAHVRTETRADSVLEPLGVSDLIGDWLRRQRGGT